MGTWSLRVDDAPVTPGSCDVCVTLEEELEQALSHSMVKYDIRDATPCGQMIPELSAGSLQDWP